jgi:hypothetical protein
MSRHVFVGVAEKLPGANRIHYFVVCDAGAAISWAHAPRSRSVQRRPQTAASAARVRSARRARPAHRTELRNSTPRWDRDILRPLPPGRRDEGPADPRGWGPYGSTPCRTRSFGRARVSSPSGSRRSRPSKGPIPFGGAGKGMPSQ